MNREIKLVKISIECPDAIPSKLVKEKLLRLRTLIPNLPEEVYIFAQTLAQTDWSEKMLPRNFVWCAENLLEECRNGIVLDSRLTGLENKVYLRIEEEMPRIVEATTPENFFVKTAQFFYPDYMSQRLKENKPRFGKYFNEL